MKKSIVLILSVTILCACSFVDETQMKTSTSISISEFINQEITSINATGASEVALSGSSGTVLGSTGLDNQTSSGTLKNQIISTVNKTPKPSLFQPQGNTGRTIINNFNDMTLSGTNLPDPLLKSTSDADVSNLINSLFDSTK